VADNPSSTYFLFAFDEVLDLLSSPKVKVILGDAASGVDVSTLCAYLGAPYSGPYQQDVTEFLHYLLHRVETTTDAGAFQAWNAILQGETSTTITCSTCNAATARTEYFVILDVSTPLAWSPGSRAESFLQLLNRDYFSQEQLRFETQFECLSDQCRGCYRDAKKTTSVLILPSMLICSLSRFDAALNKINTPVSIDEELIFRHDGVVTYDLAAFIVHIGGRKDSGHYKAYVKKKRTQPAAEVMAAEQFPTHQRGHLWFEFDDAEVTERSQGSIRALLEPTKPSDETPYVFFYDRRPA